MKKKSKLAEFVDNKLEKNNMTKEEFYEKSGIPQSTYYAKVQEEKIPDLTFDNANKIAKALNTSFVELAVAIGYINPLELYHPISVVVAREILQNNKILLKTHNIDINELNEAEISQMATMFDLMMSLMKKNS